MGNDWILIPVAVSRLGWEMPPTQEQQEQFAGWMRDGKIRYRPAIGEGTLLLPNPTLNFERSTAEVRTRVTTPSWQALRGELHKVNLRIVVHAGDVEHLSPTAESTRYSNDDALAAEAVAALKAKRVPNVLQAAKLVASRAEGNSTEESKVARMRRKIKALL